MLTPICVRAMIASGQEIEAFARADPYYKNGLVRKWCIVRQHLRPISAASRSISPYTVVHGTLKDVL